jgi:hypothetical protein
MADDPRVMEFHADDLAGVIAAVDRMRATRSGWVNLAPMVPEDQRQRPQSILGRVFSSRKPDAPMATITVGHERRDGAVGPTSIGLVHPLRERLRPWLFEHGLVPPTAWQVKQDNPMRGAVWEIPADTPTAPIVTHLMAMATALDPVDADPALRTWMAEIHA